jgi:hypothetical protein
MTSADSTRACAAALCTLALVAAGCGGPKPADDATANAVTQALRAYYGALAEADGTRACGLLTDDARKAVNEGGLGCAQAAERTAKAIPRELITELRDVDADAVKVEVDGDEATARLAVDSPYAARPRKLTIELERANGTWRVSALPEADAKTEDDPVTTCFAAGVQAYEDGQADPFWEKESRKDFVAYLAETCRRAVERKIVRERSGELTPEQRAKFQEVAGEVLREMIAKGQVREP